MPPNPHIVGRIEESRIDTRLVADDPLQKYSIAAIITSNPVISENPDIAGLRTRPDHTRARTRRYRPASRPAKARSRSAPFRQQNLPRTDIAPFVVSKKPWTVLRPADAANTKVTRHARRKCSRRFSWNMPQVRRARAPAKHTSVNNNVPYRAPNNFGSCVNNFTKGIVSLLLD